MENMSDVRIKILTFQVLYVAFTKVFEPFIDGFHPNNHSCEASFTIGSVKGSK
jgi:hypothetical protein